MAQGVQRFSWALKGFEDASQFTHLHGFLLVFGASVPKSSPGCLVRILSNHGFRLQLLRLALRLGRLGEIDEKPRSLVKIGSNSQVKSIINETSLMLKGSKSGRVVAQLLF